MASAKTKPGQQANPPTTGGTQTARPPRHILIVKIQGMGDLVLAIPAIRAIRGIYPGAHLAVVGKAGLIDILAHQSYIDELIPLDLPGSLLAGRGWRRLWKTISRVRWRRFDLLIDLSTPLSYATWIKCRCFDRLCGARQRVQARLSDCLLPFASGTAVRYRHVCHESEMNFRLMRGLVEPVRAAVPSIETSESANRFRPVSPATNEGTPCIGVCPGGKQSHRWPLQRFAACLRLLQATIAPRFVIIGNSQDQPLADQLVAAVGHGIQSTCGLIATSELPEFLSSLDILLTNDTGVMHVAAAVGTPIVAILGAGSPARYAPIPSSGPTRVLFRQAPCSPCLRLHCGHRKCTVAIHPEEVVQATLALLLERRTNQGLAGHGGTPELRGLTV